MAQQQMALSSSSSTASRGAFGSCRPAPARRVAAPLRAVHKEKQASLLERVVAPSMLAAVVALSSGLATFDAAYAPPARADEEELSPYQKRQAELERRRELLREAREKAATRANTAAPAPEAAAPAPPPAPAAPRSAPSLNSNSLQSYQAATKNRPSVPAPAPEPEAPAWGGFSFGGSSKPAEAEKPAELLPAEPAKSAAKPAASDSSSTSSMFSSDMWNTPIKPKGEAAAPAAPVVPPPAPVKPAPAPVTPFRAPEPPKPKPAPVVVQPEVRKVEAKKAAAAAPAKAGKRRGPLPLWFAEVLVLGAYAALFLAVTKYSKQSGEVLGAVWGKVLQAYAALEKLAGNKQASS